MSRPPEYAKTIFTVCKFNRQFIERLYPRRFSTFKDKIYIHHLGIDLDELSFSVSQREESTLLGVGSLSPLKGFAYLIEAFAMLIAENPSLRLKIIGGGGERKNLLHIAKRLGVGEKVELLGHLTFETVKTYMRECTILVHPSSGLGDAVPTVIKEALALGLPVIASSVAGIPELLDYGRVGLLVPTKNVEALASAIRVLLADKEKRLKFAYEGRKFAENKFDTKRNGEKFCQRIEDDLSIS